MVEIKEQMVECGHFNKPVALEDNAVILDTAYDEDGGHWTILYYLKETPEPRREPIAEAREQ